MPAVRKACIPAPSILPTSISVVATAGRGLRASAAGVRTALVQLPSQHLGHLLEELARCKGLHEEWKPGSDRLPVWKEPVVAGHQDDPARWYCRQHLLC